MTRASTSNADVVALDAVTDFLAGKITAHRAAQTVASLAVPPSAPAGPSVYSARLLFAEHARGDRTVRDLRDRLHALLDDVHRPPGL